MSIGVLHFHRREDATLNIQVSNWWARKSNPAGGGEHVQIIIAVFEWSPVRGHIRFAPSNGETGKWYLGQSWDWGLGPSRDWLQDGKWTPFLIQEYHVRYWLKDIILGSTSYKVMCTHLRNYFYSQHHLGKFTLDACLGQGGPVADVVTGPELSNIHVHRSRTKRRRRRFCTYSRQCSRFLCLASNPFVYTSSHPFRSPD